jgi:hypothetical protein
MEAARTALAAKEEAARTAVAEEKAARRAHAQATADIQAR